MIKGAHRCVMLVMLSLTRVCVRRLRTGTWPQSGVIVEDYALECQFELKLAYGAPFVDLL